MTLATYQDKFRRLTSLHGQPLFLPREADYTFSWRLL